MEATARCTRDSYWVMTLFKKKKKNIQETFLVEPIKHSVSDSNNTFTVVGDPPCIPLLRILIHLSRFVKICTVHNRNVTPCRRNVMWSMFPQSERQWKSQLCVHGSLRFSKSLTVQGTKKETDPCERNVVSRSLYFEKPKHPSMRKWNCDTCFLMQACVLRLVLVADSICILSPDEQHHSCSRSWLIRHSGVWKSVNGNYVSQPKRH